ncbi:helicase-associated domain-containing protein [Geodermatophilus sp. CPCC 205506]|uniref:helicase-associated domain-containing protein n=1 Tax=Geodermatophilus sp. CPCC 205506 TaxID=2936596 RepID=UPI003EE84A21
MDDRGWAEWLGTFSRAELTELLTARPDLVAGYPPRTLWGLAGRICHAASVAAAVDDLRLPERQVWEAVRALGERRRRPDLDDLLGVSGPDHTDAVGAAVGTLIRRGLLRPDDGALVVPLAAELPPYPLGVPGPRARTAWAEATLPELQRALRRWGERPPARKAEALDHVVRVVSDPARVRARFDTAPDDVRRGLLRWAGRPEPGAGSRPLVAVPADRWWISDSDDDLEPPWGDPDRYREDTAARRWAAEHGLAVTPAHGWGGVLPAEVALAVRGERWRAPFDPVPPGPAVSAVPPAAVDSAAAEAVARLLRLVADLLDRVRRQEIASLAGGGIGVRELRRLGKDLGADEAQTRLALETARAAGLVRSGVSGIEPTTLAAEWAAGEPADQVVPLVLAWWRHEAMATRARDGDGRPVPALGAQVPCRGCAATRRTLLAATAAVPGGAAGDPAALRAAALWSRPAAHTVPGESAPLDTLWSELHLVGVVGAGAISAVGRALLAGDEAGLRRWADGVLPARVATVRFGSDLTAVATGSPAASLAAVLDSCADRESTGAGVIWRLGPPTIRRALDAGRTGDDLVTALREVTDRDLPQPLVHLVQDVARRHGHLRVTAAACVLTGVDEALVAQVLADRRLGRLGLRQVGPTVLAASAAPDVTLAALRAAGYLPVADAEPPRGTAEAAAARHAARDAARRIDDAVAPARPRLTVVPPPVADVARALLDGARTEPPADPLPPGLAGAAPHLTPGELALLAEAVGSGGRVSIVYRAASGAVTDRVIRAPEVLGHVLEAWCELRGDERVFSLSGVLRVLPAP